MYGSQKHFFRDEHDNRQVVVTSQYGAEFYAELTEGDFGVGRVGIGSTRMEAIADLREHLDAMEPEFLR